MQLITSYKINPNNCELITTQTVYRIPYGYYKTPKDATLAAIQEIECIQNKYTMKLKEIEKDISFLYNQLNKL